MAKKEYAFYPGCSSQLRRSASNYLTSVKSMCETLDIKLNEIPDWNCCGASIGYAEGGELPRHVLNARNFALAEQHLPGQDIVADLRRVLAGRARNQGEARMTRRADGRHQRGAEGSGPHLQGRRSRCATWSRC